MRYRATVAYVGTFFHGWQVQENAPRTVQAVLESALSEVFGEPVRAHASGRTDAGVHADGQIVHFDARALLDARPAASLRSAVNRKLPWDVRILRLDEAAAEFHARSSAAGKRYVYRFSREAVLAPRDALFVSPISGRADATRMALAAKEIVGTRDFFPFSTSGTPTETTIRTVTACGVREDGPRLTIEIEADGFLRGMARAIAGALADVGRGRFGPDFIGQIFAARSRALAAPKARPRGLTLERVFYPFFDNIEPP
ncbi:MAG: tRNA pseudouridine(38-40) synthase TruA [Thermoanaerobaculia bacterium]